MPATMQDGISQCSLPRRSRYLLKRKQLFLIHKMETSSICTSPQWEPEICKKY